VVDANGKCGMDVGEKRRERGREGVLLNGSAGVNVKNDQ
jgi:hypothetical protein